MPLPPNGVVLGRVPGATVELRSLSTSGATLVVDYGPLKRVTYWSGIFGIGATPIHNRTSVTSTVSSMSLRVGRHTETATSGGMVTVSFPVTYAALSWTGPVRLPKRGQPFTITVPVSESYTVPRGQGGVTWPAFPWWWSL